MADLSQVRKVVWAEERCPGCGRKVWFWPQQTINECGWCHATVTR
jgi:ribosomal protein S27AE